MESIVKLVGGRQGHFKFESGYHSDYWMDMETLCLQPEALQPYATALAHKLQPYRAEFICGALNEGAFVALMVAEKLGTKFAYTERFVEKQQNENHLFPVNYKLPGALQRVVSGKRVVIVNDVISAGSAVRGTLTDLNACGTEVVAIGALLEFGSEFRAFTAENDIPYESLEARDSNLWKPSDCPLCREGKVIEELF